MIRQFWIHFKNSHFIILLVILLFAGVVRFWHVNTIPNGFYWDEAAIMYDAWGISLDGKDQWGTSFPLVFTSFGDGKLPFTEYALALLFRIGGFHVEWLRYLTASFGIMLVLGMYVLAHKLFPHAPTISLLTAFLTASSSWAIHFSRFGLEAGIGTTLMVWSVYTLYQSRKISNDIIGIILLVLSAYTYHGNLLIAPFIMLFLGWKKLRNVLFIVLLIPLILALHKSSWTRAEQTVFWQAPNFSWSIQSITTEITQRLVDQVSPAFWIKGVQTHLRQAVPDYFVVFPVEICFLGIGLLGLRFLPRKRALLLLGWFLFGMVPSLIGNPNPHAIRIYNILPVLKILEAYGLYLIIKRSSVIGILLSGIYLIHLGLFWRNYTTQYAISSAGDFQYGYKELMTTLKRQGNSLEDTFVISPMYGQPYIYTLLFWKISPSEYRAGGLANITYRPINWPEERRAGALYAGTPFEIPPDDPRVVERIDFPNSTTSAWIIAR